MRPLANRAQPEANGHSAFGSWALEQRGSPITDVMRALRQPSKPHDGSGSRLPPVRGHGVDDQPAELRDPVEASDDDAEVSWWDTELPGEGPNQNGNSGAYQLEHQAAAAAEGEAADASQGYAAGSRVWQRGEASAELQTPSEGEHGWSAADEHTGREAEAAWKSDQQQGNGPAVQPDESSSAEQQWRLAYAQWYEAYMHWYASYTQWHAGYQQHCAGQESGSGSAQQQASRHEQEHWK